MMILPKHRMRKRRIKIPRQKNQNLSTKEKIARLKKLQSGSILINNKSSADEIRYAAWHHRAKLYKSIYVLFGLMFLFGPIAIMDSALSFKELSGKHPFLKVGNSKELSILVGALIVWFLGSVIAELHKKNLEVSKSVDAIIANPNISEINLLKVKKSGIILLLEGVQALIWPIWFGCTIVLINLSPAIWLYWHEISTDYFLSKHFITYSITILVLTSSFLLNVFLKRKLKVLNKVKKDWFLPQL